LPTAFLVFLALKLGGKEWKAELHAMLRVGAPVYYGLALVIPLLALAVPQLLIVGVSKISWELEQALPTQSFSLDRLVRSFFWFDLRVVPGALLEEMAWRAYLLPLAITVMGVRRGIFVVGVVWAAWHLPFDVDTGADAMHVVAAVGSRLLFTGVHSIAFAWLFLRSRSALCAGLLHATFNFLIDWTWGSLPYTGQMANWLGLAVWAVGGYLLFKYWPPQVDSPQGS
jgi:membrane protease YdiL (CAAX protease family)